METDEHDIKVIIIRNGNEVIMNTDIIASPNRVAYIVDRFTKLHREVSNGN